MNDPNVQVKEVRMRRMHYAHGAKTVLVYTLPDGSFVGQIEITGSTPEAMQAMADDLRAFLASVRSGLIVPSGAQSVGTPTNKGSGNGQNKRY